MTSDKTGSPGHDVEARNARSLAGQHITAWPDADFGVLATISPSLEETGRSRRRHRFETAFVLRQKERTFRRSAVECAFVGEKVDNLKGYMTPVSPKSPRIRIGSLRRAGSRIRGLFHDALGGEVIGSGLSSSKGGHAGHSPPRSGFRGADRSVAHL